MKIVYKKATLFDIKGMQELVAPEVVSGNILQRSDDEIASNIRSYILAFDNDQLVGFSALHIHAPTLAEIRSLIVKDGYRGQKIGENLVNNCIEEAKTLFVKRVLCLTYKQSFFQRLGFIEIPKESIPEHKIWVDCIKCKHFPVCNEVSLIKSL
jgi:amino-acid N-acetyltransferase